LSFTKQFTFIMPEKASTLHIKQAANVFESQIHLLAKSTRASAFLNASNPWAIVLYCNVFLNSVAVQYRSQCVNPGRINRFRGWRKIKEETQKE